MTASVFQARIRSYKEARIRTCSSSVAHSMISVQQNARPYIRHHRHMWRHDICICGILQVL